MIPARYEPKCEVCGGPLKRFTTVKSARIRLAMELRSRDWPNAQIVEVQE